MKRDTTPKSCDLKAMSRVSSTAASKTALNSGATSKKGVASNAVAKTGATEKKVANKHKTLTTTSEKNLISSQKSTTPKKHHKTTVLPPRQTVQAVALPSNPPIHSPLLRWRELLTLFYSYKEYPSFQDFLQAHHHLLQHNEGAILVFLYAQRMGSHGTLETYLQNICAFFNEAGKHYSAVTVGDINAYIDTLIAKNCMKNTLKIHVATLKSFYKKLTAAGLATFNPTELVTTPKVSNSAKVSHVLRKSLTFAEVENFCHYLENHAPARDTCIFYLLARGGLRVSELCALQWKHFMFIHGAWAVQVLGKGDKERTIIVSAKTSQLLLAYRAQRYGIDAEKVEALSIQELPMFAHLQDISQHLTRDSINKMLARYCDALHVRRFSPHALRHTCFTNLSQLGTPITTIRRMAGHENINTTAIYIDAGDTISEGAKAFDALERQQHAAL